MAGSKLKLNHTNEKTPLTENSFRQGFPTPCHTYCSSGFWVDRGLEFLGKEPYEKQNQDSEWQRGFPDSSGGFAPFHSLV